ncbi:hypothetical protein HMPREF9012_1895 [Bacteroidetes bacterium oral taxon 272 str. F0290]|nr:hypothetical protein HMPREF9012_1895 [Bacteroidetes bacterium oral taxon 272 str. F0290]
MRELIANITLAKSACQDIRYGFTTSGDSNFLSSIDIVLLIDKQIIGLPLYFGNQFTNCQGVRSKVNSRILRKNGSCFQLEYKEGTKK